MKLSSKQEAIAKFDLTFEYFLETARYTLAEPVKQNEEAEVLRTFMKYMMVRFKLVPIELGWNSVAAGLGAETFFGQYRQHRMLRPAIAFALNSKNWRAPITELSPAANRFFRYEQTQVPSGLWMLRELPPPLFATLMVPKLIKEGRLSSFEAQVCGWVKGPLKDEKI